MALDGLAGALRGSPAVTAGTGDAAGAAPTPRAVVAALAALLALRTGFWLLAPPNSDEAYYWLWGLHPALSYLDHPGLHAWVQWLFHAALGSSLLVLRLPTALTAAGTIWLVARLVARLPGAPRRPLALAAAVVLASPLFLMMTAFAWHDHLLIFLALLSGSLFLDVLAEVAAGRRGSTARLLAAGAILGLAALAKYSAVFLALGVAAAITADPRLRRLWRDPRLYGAALLCLLAMSPLIAWNVAHGFASFRFHTAGRVEGGVRLHATGPLQFLGPSVLFLSPVLCWAMAAGWRRLPAGPGLAGVLRRTAGWVIAGSTALFLAISPVVWSRYYWNVVAYPLLLAPAAAWLAARPRVLRWHLGYGVALAAAMLVHGAVLPLSALVPGIEDDDSREVYGWGEVAAAVRAERLRQPAGFVALTDYRPASHLAWALRDPDVAVLGDWFRSAFDGWFDPARHCGEDAVLVSDRRAQLGGALPGAFERVEHVATVPVVRLGVHLKDYELWRGVRFRGGPVAPAGTCAASQ